MPKVIIHVGPRGVERVQLDASTATTERASLQLYRKIRPGIEIMQTRATSDGARGQGTKRG